jgi:putative thioredoxin
MDIAAGAPTGAGGADLIKDTTTATFTQDVLEASRTVPVIVDFWAPWCEPCKTLTPILEKLVRAAGGRVRLVKMNIDEHPSIAGQLRVQSIPAVFAFKDGKPLDGFAGALQESQVKEFIDRIVGQEVGADLDAAVESGLETLEQGDAQGAAEIFAAVLSEQRDHIGALTGLARCYLHAGDIERAEQTIALVPPDKQDLAQIASVRAAIDLHKQSEGAGDTVELRAAVDADPNNHQARYDLAIALVAANDRPGGVEHLLELMRRDRQWDDDAARKQLLQLFEAWGTADPASIEGRRQLSLLLFS